MTTRIFNHVDYREYLREAYQMRHKADKNFTYRKLAESAGFHSPGFFTNIIQGKRNISQETIANLAMVFKLKKKEREYFELLVLADQSKQQAQKKYYLDRALALRAGKLKIKNVGSHQFYEKWIYSAVREVLSFKNFRGDYQALAKSIYPPITPREARGAVEFLESTGFIRKNRDGSYNQTAPFISSSEGVTSVAISAFHMQTAELAKQAIDKCPKDARNISTLTLGISREGYAEIVGKIRAFRRELMQLAQRETVKDSVYHINFHVFPMTKPEVEKS